METPPEVSWRTLLFRAWPSFILAGVLFIGISSPAGASYLPFNTNVNLNVGIGTATPMGALAVMSGNVGIGTWAPVGALDIKTGNNVLVETGKVGIGTFAMDTKVGRVNVEETSLKQLRVMRACHALDRKDM